MMYSKIEQDYENFNELSAIDYEIIIDKDKLNNLRLEKELDPNNNASILVDINLILHGNLDKLIDIYNKKRNNINLDMDEIEISLCAKVIIKRKVPLYFIRGARALMDHEKKMNKTLVLSKKN